jgi:5-methylcytosine-specific restriction enzyme A
LHLEVRVRPGRDDRSPEALAYRRLYKDARWRGPNGRRAQQLAKQPLCERCLKRINDGSKRRDGSFEPHPKRRYLVANHKVPHRGDERLFFEGELETLCPDDHDIVAQQEERGRIVEDIDPVTGLPFE